VSDTLSLANPVRRAEFELLDIMIRGSHPERQSHGLPFTSLLESSPVRNL
jgi:hypothetical protein